MLKPDAVITHTEASVSLEALLGKFMFSSGGDSKSGGTPPANGAAPTNGAPAGGAAPAPATHP
jgi:phospholipid/cholesterol/gamma-HCH transport system substrate-binding protein